MIREYATLKDYGIAMATTGWKTPLFEVFSPIEQMIIRLEALCDHARQIRDRL